MATSWVVDPVDPSKAFLGELTLNGVHDALACFPGPCVVHAPSEHHMRDWPMTWRNDRGICERHCPHGVGHPDPDQRGDGVHGCDGCCREAL